MTNVQSPRFWEREYNIYGGISFFKQTVDLVWDPSGRLFSFHGVFIAGFYFEADDAGVPTEFGRLDSMAAKLKASRADVEKLHLDMERSFLSRSMFRGLRFPIVSAVLPTLILKARASLQAIASAGREHVLCR